MLKKVKLALRKSGDAFDAEIIGLIAAAAADLRVAGASVPVDAMHAHLDPLIERAIIQYCKASFGEGENSEKLLASYESMRTKLCLAGDYRAQ